LKKRILLILSLVLAFGFALAGCGNNKDSSSNGDNGSSGKSGGDNTILVGADTTFPPFETETNGKVTGFDIDMINAIAKAEGLKVETKTMPFDGLIPSLQAGSIDAAVAGITIKKSRMENVDFSNAYYKSGLSILVKKDSDIKSFDDLKGHLIATKKATSSVDYMTSHGIDSKNIKQFKNITEAYQALETGGADAVLFDNPVNANFKAQHDDVQIVGDLLTGEYYGIAVTQKKPELLKKLNDGLAKIKKDGTYKKLFDKYFGGDTNGLVKDVKKPSDVALEE
jgi:polar amino acid transport system substrate-binding protein/glutamine transport system substrate-binding protein